MALARSAVLLMFSLALAGAACASASVVAVDTGKYTFTEHYPAEEELEAFASCTWPLQPFTQRPRFAAPKIGKLAQDEAIIPALGIFLALGAVAMCIDICTLDDDDKSEEFHPTSTRSGNLRTFALIVLVVAFILAVPDADANPMCLRSPVVSSAQGEVAVSWRRHAAQELQRFNHVEQPHVNDATLAVSLFAAGLLGALVMSSDVTEMVAEEKQKLSDDTHVATTPPSDVLKFLKLLCVLSLGVIITLLGGFAFLTSVASSAGTPTLPVTEGVAMDELRSLASSLLTTDSPKDVFVIAGLGMFALLGCLFAFVDFKEFEAHEEEAFKNGQETRQGQKEKYVAPCAAKRDMSWRQYIAGNWRLVVSIGMSILCCIGALGLLQDAVTIHSEARLDRSLHEL